MHDALEKRQGEVMDKESDLHTPHERHREMQMKRSLKFGRKARARGCDPFHTYVSSDENLVLDVAAHRVQLLVRLDDVGLLPVVREPGLRVGLIVLRWLRDGRVRQGRNLQGRIAPVVPYVRDDVKHLLGGGSQTREAENEVDVQAKGKN